MNEKLQSLKIIHIALCVGVTLAYFFLGDLQTLEFLNVPKIDSTSFIYLLIGFCAMFLGNMVYNQRLKTVDPKSKFEERIAPYMTASIIRWAILEGAAFLILFLKKEFLVVGLFLIVYMIFTRPSSEGMKRDFAAVSK
ncbi:MFS transporter [Flagellimonas sp.]|uniref:MFS transporter n=1 Tax=Flagellimonas sp. TaxID=2058762 RepID=UPI003F49DA5B